jgi:MYXO-CTERM domain-containing protein
MKTAIAACALLAAPLLAAAHDGHGPTGAHWHATDAWGFAVVGALAVAALWFARRK